MAYDKKIFPIFENYIYMYHTNTFIVLPIYPETLSESLGVTFASSTPLTRTAPIYSYSNSGPRSISFQFKLHRDLMKQVNYGVSNTIVDLGDDYVDTLIKQIQAISLPAYDAASSIVSPPIIAVRIGNQLYCKGIVTGSLGVSYEGPILDTNKYAVVNINFNLYEIDPYDAQSVQRVGSFRGFNKNLERRLTTNIIL